MSFRKISIAKCDQNVLSIKCNPVLDVVALLMQNGNVDLYRFLNLKKIASLIPSKNLQINRSKELEKVIDFQWSPNGKYIAIIYNGCFSKDKSYFPHNIALDPSGNSIECEEDNSRSRHYKYLSCVAVFELSTHKQVFFRNCPRKIKRIFWASRRTKDNSGQERNDHKTSLPHDTLEIPFLDLFTSEKDFFSFLGYEYSKLRPEVKANKFQTMFRKTEKAIEMDLDKFDREIYFKNQSSNETFSIQTVASDSGSVDFYAFGIYKIMSLRLADLMKDCGISQFSSEHGENNIEVEQVWNGSNIHELLLMLRNKSTNKRSILSLSLSVLEKRSQELYAFISLMFQIDLRAEFLDRSLEKMNEIYQDLCSSINRMLSEYLPRKREEKTEDNDPIDIYSAASKTVKLAAKDFMLMLLTGETTPEMDKFLTDMSETDFKKLALNVEMYFVRLLKFNSEEMQTKLYHLLCYLNILKSMATEKFRFADLTLDVIEINNFIRNTHAMLIKTTQMQKSICDSMKKLRSFIRWLSNCSIIYAKECETDTRLDPNLDDDEYFLLNSTLTNCDLHLVMEFLRENSLTHGFCFPEVEFYLKTELPDLNNFQDTLIDNKNSDSNDDCEKDIPYRAFIAERREDKFLNKYYDKILFDEKENRSDALASSDDGSTVMMDVTCGETVIDESDVSMKDGSIQLPEEEKNVILNFENFESFEKEFFNDNDDVDKFDADIYKPMSLYAHLVQIYDDFTQLLQVKTCQNLSFLQSKLFKNRIDNVCLIELPNSIASSYGIQQLYDNNQGHQFFVCSCPINRELFVYQKDQESIEFSGFSMEFHYNDEQQNRIQLWIRDFKLFDAETLTVILSEFDKEFSKTNPQDAAEDFEDDGQKQQMSNILQESGQYLLQIRFQSFYFTTQQDDDSFNTSNEFPKLDICLDSKIPRRWLTDIEDQVVDGNIELRELARGTVDAVYTSSSRNIAAIVADNGKKVTFYDIADSEEADE